LQKEGSAKVVGHPGKISGGMIGDALFDDVGGEIGEAVGDKIGNLAGNLAFEHVAKIHIKNNDEPPSNDVSQTNTDGP
jgi:outer membrane lipoprotein SlyB